MLAEEELSYKVRGAIYEVYNQLGFGYLEKIYERALSHELKACSIDVQCQGSTQCAIQGHRGWRVFR